MLTMQMSDRVARLTFANTGANRLEKRTIAIGDVQRMLSPSPIPALRQRFPR